MSEKHIRMIRWLRNWATMCGFKTDAELHDESQIRCFLRSIEVDMYFPGRRQLTLGGCPIRRTCGYFTADTTRNGTLTIRRANHVIWTGPHRDYVAENVYRDMD